MRKLAIFLVIYFRNALKLVASVLTQEENGLGMIEKSERVAALNEKNPSKKRVHFTVEERSQIRKCGAVNGATNVVKKFKNNHSCLAFGESTT